MAEQAQALANIEQTVVRQVEFPDIPHKIHVVIGMRRVGKTTFLLQKIHQLLTVENIPRERILYINFEDDRLLPCSQAQLRSLLESFYEFYPHNHEHECYFFLDEIQNVDGWDLVIRRFFETRRVKIYLSGSSAKMLSKEISTSLRGRAIATEIWPFSFQEFLSSQGIEFKGDLWTRQQRDIMYQQLKLFFEKGGFPEAVHQTSINARHIIQDYVELVIMRDVVERYKIKNITLIKYLIKTLVKNTGCGFSVNKFYHDIRSQKIEGSVAVIHDYLGYLEDAFFAFLTPLYDESLRRVQSNPRKIYTIDSGVVKAFSLSLNQNFGHLFENLIYLDLRRQRHAIHYALTDDRYEIDFFTQNAVGKCCAYQVVWDTLDKDTLMREQRALDALKNEKGIEGVLMTPDIYLEMIWRSITTGKPFAL